MRHVARGVATLALFAVACALDAAALSVASTRNVARLVASFNEPVYLATPNQGRRLFVVERAGRIRVIRSGKVRRRPFLDISGDVITGAQRGLWSMAFAPDYARSGRFYVMYAATDDTVQVDEFQRSDNPDRAMITSRRPVLNVGLAGPYHHGGQLQFGPDGLLYIGTGVSDNYGLAQDLGDLHGKILRLDPRAAEGEPYTVPADNPFVAGAGARSEIWAFGLRNPWRFSFDRVTGDLAIGDVGEGTAEEIDFVARTDRPGVNFGFSVFEGTQQMLAGATPPRYVPPVIEHRHNQSPTFCGAIGGYVVRDRRLHGLYGRYVYNDLCSPTLRSALLGPGKARDDRRVGLRIPSVVSFGEDSRGRLYGIDLAGGVYRLEPRRPPPSERRNRGAGRGE